MLDDRDIEYLEAEGNLTRALAARLFRTAEELSAVASPLTDGAGQAAKASAFMLLAAVEQSSAPGHLVKLLMRCPWPFERSTPPSWASPVRV